MVSEVQNDPFVGDAPPLILYGAGGVGCEVAKVLVQRGCRIFGFIDRAGGCGAERMGFPVHRRDQVPAEWRKCIIVLTMFNREVHEPAVVAELQAAGFMRVITFLEIHHVLAGGLPPRFWLGPRSWVEQMRPQWERVRDRWADDHSVAVFDALMAMRLVGRYEAAAEATATAHQYWPADVPGWRTAVPLKMIDGGAFDGDTIRSLEAAGACISGVAAFEPDPSNYVALVQRHAPESGRYPAGMLLVPCGLDASICQVRFAAAQGEASRVSADGNAVVQCVAVDELMPRQSFDLVKLDVEGAEAHALRGMRGLISQCRPRLAVSMYHRPGDLWELIEVLDGIVSGAYRYHLRVHYSFGFDVVCYAVPV